MLHSTDNRTQQYNVSNLQLPNRQPDPWMEWHKPKCVASEPSIETIPLQKNHFGFPRSCTFHASIKTGQCSDPRNKTLPFPWSIAICPLSRISHNRNLSATTLQTTQPCRNPTSEYCRQPWHRWHAWLVAKQSNQCQSLWKTCHN